MVYAVYRVFGYHDFCMLLLATTRIGFTRIHLLLRKTILAFSFTLPTTLARALHITFYALETLHIHLFSVDYRENKRNDVIKLNRIETKRIGRERRRERERGKRQNKHNEMKENKRYKTKINKFINILCGHWFSLLLLALFWLVIPFRWRKNVLIAPSYSICIPCNRQNNISLATFVFSSLVSVFTSTKTSPMRTSPRHLVDRHSNSCRLTRIICRI